MRVAPALSMATGQAAISTSMLSRSHLQNFASLLPALEPGYQRIYLLRHGETEWNRLGKYQGGGFDIELNEDGKEQASRVAALLSDMPLDVVASSHLQRAFVTAGHIHDQQPRAIRVVDEGFGEMRFGDMEGTIVKGPYADLDPVRKQAFQTQINAMMKDHSLPWPGQSGESFQQVELRATDALDDLLDSYPQYSHFAVVAHGRLNKILLASLLNMKDNDGKNVVQGNTCVNVLDRCLSTSEYYAHLINYTEHVDGKDSTRKAPTMLRSRLEPVRIG